jgi:stringent starvation protein B
MLNALESSSTRPYLIRAMYEWCTDNGFTPYVAVQVDDTVQVPREYVKNGEIVLNVSFDATSSLKLGNEFIEFKARFAGSAREIVVPVGRVIAIYARENGQGMAFPAPAAVADGGAPPTPIAPASSGTSTRPYLIRALHDWCTDNGFTPYIAVFVDAAVQVPTEYVKNNEIVLNVGFEATSALKLGNEFIEFKARFGGSSREIVVPIDHVIAIYARENGQGMAFQYFVRHA